MVKKDMAGTKFLDFEFPVERGKIKEFANAICDPNPIYSDREYARSKGFDDVLMPVTFPVTFALHMPSDNFVLETTQKKMPESAHEAWPLSSQCGVPPPCNLRPNRPYCSIFQACLQQLFH